MQTITPQSVYSVFCKNKKTLFGNFDPRGVRVTCRSGEYHIETENIGQTLPDCVGKFLTVCDSSHTLR